MKRLTFTTISLLSLLFTSCIKNDNNCCQPIYEPYFVAERNGGLVRAYPGSAKVGTDSIAILGLASDAGINMNIKFTGKGVYALLGNQSKFYQKNAKDTLSRYNVGVAAGSSVEVTEYDSVKRIITGKFNLNFKRTFPATSATYPDSVKFTKGQFSVFLPNK